MNYRLSDLFDLQMGKTPDRNNSEYWENGLHQWISIADMSKCGKHIEKTAERISNAAVSGSGIRIIPSNTVIMSFKLSIGKVAITLEPMYSNEAIMAFLDKGVERINSTYLYYLLLHKDWSDGANKAVMGKTLNKATLSNVRVNIHDYSKQLVIVDVLDKIVEIIDARKQQLSALDTLTKARFVEMFGTLEKPANFFQFSTLRNLCIKITDGKHGGCSAETGTGRFFVGAREIFDDAVHYDTAPEINIEEFEKDYKRCNIEIGDFLIVNTGATIGKSAIASDMRTEHTLLQKSVALIKVNPQLLNSMFLMYCYKVNDKMYKVDSASAQPNLLLSKINATMIYVPDMCTQLQFADFVSQVDKSKIAVQKALDEAQLLFDSLMQQYFG